jgi:hypothetical protein
MRTLTLEKADFRLLMAAITFFGLLIVLLSPDAWIDPSLMPDCFPVPLP